MKLTMTANIGNKKIIKITSLGSEIRAVAELECVTELVFNKVVELFINAVELKSNGML
jgi:hypothetical protein